MNQDGAQAHASLSGNLNKYNDEMSDRLSLKMMKGWTLSSEGCPNCHVAILKQKNKTLCVGCDNAYLDNQSNDLTRMIPLEQIDQILIEPKSGYSNSVPEPSHGSEQFDERIHKSLNKIISFYKLKLDDAIQEQDIYHIDTYRDKIFVMIEKLSILNKC